MITLKLHAFLDADFKRVYDYLNEHAELVSNEEQETLIYENGLRLEKKEEVFIRKAGLNMHVENAEKARALLELLGQKIQTTWKKIKITFSWNDALVILTKAEGYGSVLELSISCEEDEQNEKNDKLKKMLAELDLRVATPEEFEKHFLEFKENN